MRGKEDALLAVHRSSLRRRACRTRRDEEQERRATGCGGFGWGRAAFWAGRAGQQRSAWACQLVDMAHLVQLSRSESSGGAASDERRREPRATNEMKVALTPRSPSSARATAEPAIATACRLRPRRAGPTLPLRRRDGSSPRPAVVAEHGSSSSPLSPPGFSHDLG